MSKVGYSAIGFPVAYVGTGSANDTSSGSYVTYKTYGGTVSTTLTSTGGNSSTAKSWASKVNATTSQSGLTAIARTEGILYEVSPGGDISLKINGVDVSWTPTSAPPTAGIAAINAV